MTYELAGLANQFWAQWDTAKPLLELEDIDYVAKQFIDKGVPVTMVKYRVVGLTEELFSRWTSDPFALGPQMNSKLTRVDLPDDEGHKLVHMRLKMPSLIANRSMICCTYRYTQLNDNRKVIITSSHGNDEIVKARKKEIGKDVVANNFITYMGWLPYEGGLELHWLSKMDAAGSIPKMIKNKVAKRVGRELQILVDYIMNGSLPEPIF